MAVMFTPLDRWWGQALAGPWTDPDGDILIVPAGSTLDGTIMGETSYWRAVYAIWAYKNGHFRRVVLSGGPAPLMRQFMTAQGVPEEVIQVEAASKSTRDNALNVRRLLASEPGRKVLLTSDAHMYRAFRTFRKAGVEVAPRPFPDVLKRATRWQSRWTAFLMLVEETAKIPYYWARGWM